MADSGTVITITPTGQHAKADVPQLPVTSEEIASAAADCERVGASVIELTPRQEAALADVVAAVRARTDLIVRVQASSDVRDLDMLFDAAPDAVSCSLGAPDDFVTDLRERAHASGIGVHLEVREATELVKLSRLRGHGRIHAVLVFGAGMTGDLTHVAEAVSYLPRDATFTASGIDAASLPVMLAAISGGGHVRIGMADTLEYAGGVAAKDNAQLAARATGVTKIAQRPPLPPAQARPILALS